MTKPEIDDLMTELDRQNRLLERKLIRSEQALRLLQEIQRGNTHLQKSLLTEIEAEKEKSDQLLQNILPLEAIRRLGEGETLIADSIESATVVFSDLVGFTPGTTVAFAIRSVDAAGNLSPVSDFVEKPVDFRVLNDKVAALLKQSGAETD